MSTEEIQPKPSQPPLKKADMAGDPVEQFDEWFSQVLLSNVIHPNSATLSTVNREGQPSGRIVLLKEYDAEGFIFYTNYESRKALDLTENPKASLVFFWPTFGRQVRVTGLAWKISWVESDHYFQTRPRGSQLGTLASSQSRYITSREELDKRYRELEEQYRDQHIPCPKNWGGFRLTHKTVEFWQEGENRLHDRFLYLPQKDGTWAIKRLAP